MWDHNTDSDYQARYGLPLSATGRIRRARIMLRPRDNEDQKVLESEIAPGSAITVTCALGSLGCQGLEPDTDCCILWLGAKIAVQVPPHLSPSAATASQDRDTPNEWFRR